MSLELPHRSRTSRGEIAFGVLGDGPPVVLVHGTPSRALVWRRVAERLRERHTVFVFDLLGFGDSERRVDQDVSLRAHGEVLAELVQGWASTPRPSRRTTSAAPSPCGRTCSRA